MAGCSRKDFYSRTQKESFSICIKREKTLTCHWGHLCHRDGVFSYALVPKLFLVDGQ